MAEIRCAGITWPGSSGVEQRIENPCVGGSNPPQATTFHFNSLVHIHSCLIRQVVLSITRKQLVRTKTLRYLNAIAENFDSHLQVGEHYLNPMLINPSSFVSSVFFATSPSFTANCPQPPSISLPRLFLIVDRMPRFCSAS